jgi:hypothetical protein
LTRPIGFAQGKLLKRRSSMVLHAFPFFSPAPEGVLDSGALRHR